MPSIPLLVLPFGLLPACTGEFKAVLEGDTADSGVAGDGGGAGDAGGSDGGGSDGGGSDGGGSDGGGSADGGQPGDGGGDGGAGDGGGGDGGYPGGTADYCHLQWPCSMTGAPRSTSEPVYVWIYEAGLTEGEGPGAGAIVEVGVGPDEGDPAGGTGWSWTRADWTADKDGLVPGDLANDEYATSFLLPEERGAYDYCGRVSLDGGGSWLYCDLADSEGNGCGGQGSTDGYLPAHAGQLTVK